MTAVLKPYPCTAINVVPIELVTRLLRDTGLQSGGVARITILRSDDAFRVPYINDAHPCAGVPERISSLPFNIAVVLLTGGVTAQSHGDPEVAARAATLYPRIEIRPIDTRDLLYHQVRLRTVDGHEFRVEGGAEVLPVPSPTTIARMYEASDRMVARIEGMAAAVDVLEHLDDIPL